MGVRADDRPWPDTPPSPLRQQIAAEHPETILAMPGWDDVLGDLPLTQGDDLCVLADEPGWPLVAGAVLFPSHWRLADKLGRPLAEVHERVPGYPAAQVDRFLDRLRPGQVAWRRNLLLHRTGDLYAPVQDRSTVPPADWWLRSERQTFRRWERSTVLFTIRTDTCPLTTLDRSTRHALADRFDAMPPTWAPYAGIGPDLPALIKELRQ
jgi:hypothetical protein